MKTFNALKWHGYTVIIIPSILILAIIIAGIHSLNQPDVFLTYKKPKQKIEVIIDTVRVYDTIKVKVYDTIQIKPTPIKKEVVIDSTALTQEIIEQ